MRTIILACLLCFFWSVDCNSCVERSQGSMSSCFYKENGTVIGNTTLEIRWDPQHIDGNNTYYFNVQQLHAPAGTTFDQGTVFLTVRIPGLDKPLYNKSQDYKCMDFMKNFPLPYCPFVFPVPGIEPPFPFKYYLKDEVPIPKGSYHVRAAMYNGTDERDKKPAFLCVDGWLIFAEVSEDSEVCARPDDEPVTYGNTLVSRAFENFFNSLLGVETEDYMKSVVDNL